MPLINSIKKQNTLDINKDITIGVALPLDETNMFKGTKTTTEQLKTNLLSLLLTSPGERLNLPNYGMGLKKLVFEQNIDLPLLKDKIEKQVEFYLPNLNIREVKTTRSEDKHSIFISITYGIKSTGITDTIQINYN
jgi:phage baseplate assembly protein W|tara:strand:+ start:353 stop:760 length:408 start_codon:yes stop_codon:yes gene_type:complete